MSELVDMFEPGERFATIGRSGAATVWQVDAQGLPRLAGPSSKPTDDEPRETDPGQRHGQRGPE